MLWQTIAKNGFPGGKMENDGKQWNMMQIMELDRKPWTMMEKDGKLQKTENDTKRRKTM